jgi:hypothetical protein
MILAELCFPFTFFSVSNELFHIFQDTAYLSLFFEAFFKLPKSLICMSYYQYLYTLDSNLCRYKLWVPQSKNNM